MRYAALVKPSKSSTFVEVLAPEHHSKFSQYTHTRNGDDQERSRDTWRIWSQCSHCIGECDFAPFVEY